VALSLLLYSSNKGAQMKLLAVLILVAMSSAANAEVKFTWTEGSHQDLQCSPFNVEAGEVKAFGSYVDPGRCKFSFKFAQGKSGRMLCFPVTIAGQPLGRSVNPENCNTTIGWSSDYTFGKGTTLNCSLYAYSNDSVVMHVDAKLCAGKFGVRTPLFTPACYALDYKGDAVKKVDSSKCNVAANPAAQQTTKAQVRSK
jgi:hypothetical protein